MIKLLIGIILCAAVAYMLYAVAVALLRSRGNKAELTAERQRAKIGARALRQIANGSGNPMLEAQIALDEIEITYDSKENQ